ncbi:helix-turn-helix domain-containing protein [Shewanella glacialipiscicola]|uniref:helix-turn-helix domain-containing protein n=1 Tax=Shewanella glacialipiscicola TaxID=614069 RepID=UPI003D7A26DC
MNENLLTLDEVCKMLDKTPATIKRFARESLLSSVQEGNELKFNEAEVKRYLSFSQRLG